jgi:hypothetical protein
MDREKYIQSIMDASANVVLFKTGPDYAGRNRGSLQNREVRLLRSGLNHGFKQSGDRWIECLIPQIHDFEMLLCLYT